MKTFRVGIILSTTYVVEAEDEEEAEELAMQMAEDDYGELNIENTNFVEQEGEDDETEENEGKEDERIS